MEAAGHWEAYNVNGSATTTDENAKFKKSNAHENGPTCPNTGSECKPSGTLGKLENVRYIYRQDVVKSKTDGKIGIVTEVAGDSDLDSGTSDDEDEDEDDNGDNNADEDIDYHEEDDLENNGSAEGTPDGNADIGNHNSTPLPADQVRVLWMNETETTYSINDVAVIDRGFLLGDYVASASDATGQVGVVVDINILVDLLTHDGSVVKNISTRELKRVGDFSVGDYVVLGSWLGRIDDVLDNVTVMFDDGSVCKVIKADPLRLKPVDRNSLKGGNFPYYPGQRVKASSSSVFKNSRWLSGLWKANQLEGTVTKVTSGSVFIYWIASAGYGPESSTPPANEQTPKNLKLLSCFAHTHWQLGDWCLLPSLPLSSSNPLDEGLLKLRLSDSIHENVSRSAQTGVGCGTVVSSEESDWNSESMENDTESSLDGYIENNNTVESSSCGSVKESFHESWTLCRKKIHKVMVKRDRTALKKVENFERALLIVNTKTNVDVAWQDGTTEQGLESTCLIPIDSPGDHEFVAEQYVVEKDAYDASQTRRVGIIRSLDAKERTACVQWLKPVTRAEDPREFDKEEVVSVYELEGHPDYDYCYGDVVVKLTQLDSLESTDEESKQLFAPNEVREDKIEHLGCNKGEITLNDETHNQIPDLSWVGNITGLRNGDIEVTWADGMISMVGPQAIYVVGRDGDESIAVGSDISDDAPSWETVEDDQMESLENVEEDLGTQNTTNISTEIEGSMMATKSSGINGALAIPRAAIGFVTRLASGIFSRGQKQTDSRSKDEIQNQGWDRRMNSSNDTCYQRSGDMDNSGALSTTGKGRDCVAEVTDLTDVAEALISLKGEPENVSLQREDSTYVFKCFDITKDPHDHYFLGTNAQSNARRKWLRKVQQDWHILQNNLPDGIYVRVYEDRMDLLRAGIVGPHGTPYQDGLFFFDFHLPLEYPDVPPSAHYHSGGWRVNPNLYEEGKVCLSLLKTWTGRGNEVWDPSSSSILQVLVSLQGLVLNSKPYFNEPGYEKQIGTAEGENKSLSYNENTFLLNCKTMMYLMRKPPKEFEELVEEHFRRRGYYILKACDAYMKGHLIGSLTKDAWISSNSNTSADSNSVGFKLMLAKIVPKLYIALSEIGGESGEFEHLQHGEHQLLQ